MIVCKKCGRELKDTASFCNMCGMPVQKQKPKVEVSNDVKPTRSELISASNLMKDVSERLIGVYTASLEILSATPEGRIVYEAELSRMESEISEYKKQVAELIAKNQSLTDIVKQFEREKIQLIADKRILEAELGALKSKQNDMICAKCGTLRKGNSVYCGNCGNKF